MFHVVILLSIPIFLSVALRSKRIFVSLFRLLYNYIVHFNWIRNKQNFNFTDFLMRGEE